MSPSHSPREPALTTTPGWNEALRRIAAERDAQTGSLDLSELGLESLPSELSTHR